MYDEVNKKVVVILTCYEQLQKLVNSLNNTTVVFSTKVDMMNELFLGLFRSIGENKLKEKEIDNKLKVEKMNFIKSLAMMGIGAVMGFVTGKVEWSVFLK